MPNALLGVLNEDATDIRFIPMSRSPTMAMKAFKTSLAPSPI